jgi:hypothetical protein
MVMNLKETVGNCVVSTVSLFFDDMVEGNYETMIIKNGEFMDYQERYETEEEAVIGHKSIIRAVKKNVSGEYS